MKTYKDCPFCHGTGTESIYSDYLKNDIGMMTCHLCLERNKDKEQFNKLMSVANEN